MAIGNVTPMVNCGTKEIISTEKNMAIGNPIIQMVNWISKETTSTENEMVCGYGLITKK
jgi:hypothetical protein